MSSSSSSHSQERLTANCSSLDSLSARKLVAMESNKNDASDSQVWHADTDPNSSTEKPVARSRKSTVGPRFFPHNFALSPENVEYVEKVFSYVRPKLGTKNTEFSETSICVPSRRNLIRDQEDEIFGVSTIDWDQSPWMRSTLLHEHAIK